MVLRKDSRPWQRLETSFTYFVGLLSITVSMVTANNIEDLVGFVGNQWSVFKV